MKKEKVEIKKYVTLKAAAFGSHFVVYSAPMLCLKCGFTENVELDNLLAEIDMKAFFLIYSKAVADSGWIIDDLEDPVLSICPTCAQDPEFEGQWETSVRRWYLRK